MEPNRVVTLKRALDELPLWGISPPENICTLHSGLTNRSYLLETHNHKYVLRLNNSNAFKLGISRRNEHRTLQAIADEDFAPDTVYACPNYSYLVTRHIEGTSFAEQKPNLREIEQLNHIIDYYQSEISLQLSPISYMYQLKAYYQTALECNTVDEKTDDEWQQFLPQLEAFEAQLPKLSFCHGDLTPGNIIRHKGRLKIIDWEYACAGHPMIDKLTTGIYHDQDDTQYQQLDTVVSWLHRLWLLIIPHYPKLPEEDGRQHTILTTTFDTP